MLGKVFLPSGTEDFLWSSYVCTIFHV